MRKSMSKSRRKCVARGQSTQYCDGCAHCTTKCPQRDKWTTLKNTANKRQKIKGAAFTNSALTKSSEEIYANEETQVG